MRIWLHRLIGIWSMSMAIGLLTYFIIASTMEGSGINISNLLYPGVSVLLFAIGFYFLKKAYIKRPGVAITPLWVPRFNDFISLTFGGAAAIGFSEMVLVRFWEAPNILNDEFIFFMSIFFLVFGIPVLVWYTSRLTGQSLEVTAKEIKLHGISGESIVRWDDIDCMKLSDEYVAVGRVGTLMPRKLQQRLKIISNTGYDLVINEPQLKWKKKEIIALMQNHIPENRKGEFSKVLMHW